MENRLAGATCAEGADEELRCSGVAGTVDRRSFLGLGVGASLAALTGGARADGNPATRRLTFLAFADLHFAPGVFPHDDRSWLERILDRAERKNASFVIHAGDFVHDPVKCADFVRFYNDFRIPTYHTLGNHDTEGCSVAETLAAYRLEKGYYFFDRDGFRIVVFDTNHFKADGKFVHFEGGNYRTQKGLNWTVSEEQYAWAEQIIGTSPHPCVVFMHQSCEREHGGMPDWERMRGLFRWINRHKGPKVRLVVNGHHHTDGFRIVDGIPYLDLNSANYKYYAQSHRLYPSAYHREHTGAGHVIAWKDPISAVITLGTDGYLKIEGQRSEFFCGISPEKAGFPQRDRPVTPNIQSLEMTLNYESA